MVLSLFSKRKPAPSPAPSAQVPADVRVYAVGDIHGRDDLFAELLALIEADHAARPAKRKVLILLGDLVDRGPTSAEVVERALHLSQSGEDVRFLAGNHEEIFLLALEGKADALKLFCRIGGRETTLSYGVDEDVYNNADYDQLLALLLDRVPPEHIAFLASMEDVIEIGDYAFVHAGIRPGVPLTEQKLSDLRWIRREFLEHAPAHERIIVHGHTITDEIDERANRIGIDTGAYSSGKLTAIALEGSERWFLQTGG